MSVSQKVGDLFVQIKLRGAKDIEEQIRDVQGRVNNARKRLLDGSKDKGGIGSLFGMGVGIGAGFFTVQTALNALRGTLSVLVDYFRNLRDEIQQAYLRLSNLQKIADRLGTSFSWISKVRLLIADSNMSMEEFEQSMAAFQRNLETFSQGVGESKQTFEGLGITPEMLLSWGSLENQMLNIIERLGSISDQSKRAGAAMRIFGEQGRKLLPLVSANKELYRVMMLQADFLGMNLGAETGRVADETRDHLVKMGMQFNAIMERMSMIFAPAINEVLAVAISLSKVFMDISKRVSESTNGAGSLWKYITDIAGAQGNMILQVVGALTMYQGMMLEATAKVGKAISMAGLIVGTLLKRIDDSFGVLGQKLSAAGIDLTDASLNMLQASSEMDGVGRTLRTSGSTFANDVSNAYQEWLGLLEQERRAMENGPMPELTEAVSELNSTFRGEAMQRNAATMQAFYRELPKSMKSADKSLQDIKNEFKKGKVVLRIAN